jgi:putative peptide maturation dehydrogenase
VTQVRRTAFAFYYLDQDRLADAVALLRGEDQRSHALLVALAVLTGERHALSQSEFDLLMSLPADQWVKSAVLDDDLVASLTEKGLLISDSDDPHDQRLRSREESLSGNYWNLYAALYHYMTQWSGVHLDAAEPDGTEASTDPGNGRELLALLGPPPSPFGESRSGTAVPLPNGEREGELFRTLLARRTVRSFNLGSSMTVEQLSTVLRYVFGYHGFADTAPEVVCVNRTSPSGGAMHPIEAYPIVTDVAGVEPGIYRYDCHGHSLELIEPLDQREGRRLATSFMCGQSHLGGAHVSFVLAARFHRNHWKYRWHQRAYAAILMDAAHLSQTLYLVSTELGLRAFVTVAINGQDIEERLGLDGIGEGVIAMTGCGVGAEPPY